MLSLFTKAKQHSKHNKQSIGLHLAGLAKSGSLSDAESKKLKAESKKYLGESDYLKEFPIVWKQVGETKTFVGKGMGKNNKIRTLESMKDVLKGDKVIIKGSHFAISDNGWKIITNGEYIFWVNQNAKGKKITVKAPLGSELAMTVFRKVVD